LPHMQGKESFGKGGFPHRVSGPSLRASTPPGLQSGSQHWSAAHSGCHNNKQSSTVRTRSPGEAAQREGSNARARAAHPCQTTGGLDADHGPGTLPSHGTATLIPRHASRCIPPRHTWPPCCTPTKVTPGANVSVAFARGTLHTGEACARCHQSRHPCQPQPGRQARRAAGLLC
jgi:hypothetical protein